MPGCSHPGQRTVVLLSSELRVFNLQGEERAWSLSSCAANAWPKPSQAGAKLASSAVALPKKRRALSCCPAHR